MEPIWELMRLLFKAHPWHGVSIGGRSPEVLTTYIELVPTDTVKYELDKINGHLKIDRPQLFSNVCPTPYGLVPQTFCGEQVAALCAERTGREGIVGDQDPLDICVLTEKTITHGDLFLQARPIGGLRMLDGNEADDKIVAVMQDDTAFGDWHDIDDCPAGLIERLRHYFLTYKSVPGSRNGTPCEITHVYGRQEAYEVLRRAQADYTERFADLEGKLAAALHG